MKLGRAVTGFAVILGIIFVWILYQNAQYGKSKAEWERDKKVLDLHLSVLRQDIIDEQDKTREALESADEHAVESKRLEELLKMEKEEHARVLDNIRTLAPDEIVQAHHFHLRLGETHIWLNKLGVQFTLSAARVNLEKLVTLSFTLNTEIPKYQGIVAEKVDEIADLREAVIGFEVNEKNFEDAIKNLEEQLAGETKLRIKSDKRFNFKLFSKDGLLVFAGGVALGLVASAVF